MNDSEKLNIENAVTLTPEEIFAKRYEKFNSFYLQLVVLCAIVAAATIAVAVLADIIVGICVAIMLALFYVYFSRDELRRSLGIVCLVCGASLRVTSIHTVISISLTDAFVPARLMWYDVTEIASGALANEKTSELKRLHVPKTVTLIEKGAFDGCDTLNTLIFERNEEEFKKITVEEDLSHFDLIFGVPFPKNKKGDGTK
jgi:hypothetical protein